MSADRERAERLAEAEYEYEPPELKAAYVAGCLASNRLSEVEWAAARYDTAEAIYRSDYPSGTPWGGLSGEELVATTDEYFPNAEAAMIALGFTRASEPGGDAC